MEENTNITNVEEIEETAEVETEPEVLEETENETTEVDVTTGVIVSAVVLVVLAGYGTYQAGKQAVKFVKRKIDEGKASFEERQAAAEEKKGCEGSHEEAASGGTQTDNSPAES